MLHTYTIEQDTHAVRIFQDGSEVASIFQPDYPNTAPWGNAEAASTWAELYIASVEDENAPYAPAGPGILGEAKPTPEEIEEMKAQRQLENQTP